MTTLIYIYIIILPLFEVPNLANLNCRKLWIFDQKLVGSHSIFYDYFDKY